MAEEITKVIENVDELFPEIVVNGESHVSERYVEPEPTPSQSLPQSSEERTEESSQPQQTVQGEYVDTLELNGVAHDLKDSPLSEAVDNIEGMIPNQASAQNQLADKNFVNSSIATNTANFLGTYTSLADIEAIQNPTNNDYAFLETADGAGNNVYDRYKYSAEDGEWLFEYELNNSSFTAEQWATINSGITQVSDTVQDGDTNPVSSDAVYEALQSAGGGGGAQCSTAGNVQAKVATMDGFVLNTGVTFPISFANSNSYDGKITLNVNSTGAKDVYINNAVSSSTNKTLNAGSYICRYNGTNYYIDTSYAVTNARNASYATSATTARNARNTIAICSTASAIVAKTATLDGYALTSGDRIPLYMTNNNTANSATLNVNSTGSKRIRINGSTVVNETYKNLPAGFYMAHYDGTYWNLYNLVNMSTEASFNGSSFAITLNRAYGALGVVTWYMSPDVNFIVFVNGLKIQWGHRTDKTTNGYTLTLPLSYTSESSFACFASANDGRYGYESLENKIVSASSFTVNRQAYTCTNWSYFCIGY